eukprot:TRINITY_DN29852_c0_g1_i1.p1 TRINITY_DN29852_c0_g1~~TRINITY_DN29852_c0_g1_i1.p1  ORF type:complete len:276 (+),score=64.80 TRINITY_DN29852_c0_g1_i1:99-830(+)
MLAVATAEAHSRVKRVYAGALLHCCASLLASVLWTVLVCVTLVVQPEPWWRPDYFIPLWGMILGSAVTGVSMGLDTLTAAICGEGGGNVETLLCSGASRLEAVRPVVAQAVETGLSSQLATMSVMGVVAIPGMMTGQILGGTPPAEAVRYQMVIVFFLSAAVVSAVVCAILLAVTSVIDGGLRLRRERLQRNTLRSDCRAALARLLWCGGPAPAAGSPRCAAAPTAARPAGGAPSYGAVGAGR